MLLTEKKLWSFYTTDEEPMLHGGRIALRAEGEGDLTALPAEREAFREHLGKSVASSVLHRFAREIRAGDYVLLRTEHGKPVTIGRVTGGYAFAEGEHRRSVQWLRRLAHSEVSAGAMRELSYASAAPVFRIRYYAAELLAAAGVDPSVEASGLAEPTARSLREFVAGLMQAMGYRVTLPAADGADFFARRDELLPRMPVMVRDTADVSDVAALRREGRGGFGLLFTLGELSPDVRAALDEARLRGVDGAELRALTRTYYAALPARVRRLIPREDFLPVA